MPCNVESDDRCFVESVEGDNCCNDCDPRAVHKADGRVIPLAEICIMKAVAGKAVVLDVRDPNEVAANKGGEAIATAINVPINMNGEAQSKRSTTLEEFRAKLLAKGLLESGPEESKIFIAHCTGGGRAAKAVKLLKELGMEAYNGGGPTDVREAIEEMSKK